MSNFFGDNLIKELVYYISYTVHNTYVRTELKNSKKILIRKQKNLLKNSYYNYKTFNTYLILYYYQIYHYSPD